MIRSIAFGGIVVALLVLATAEAWGAQAPPTATAEPTMADDMGMMMGMGATPETGMDGMNGMDGMQGMMTPTAAAAADQ